MKRTVLTLALLALASTAAHAGAAPEPAAVPVAPESASPPACAAAGALDGAVATAPAWTFEGCFTYFPAAPCRDVFRDDSGALWICGDCGTTKKASPRTCSPLTGSGLWCS